MFLLSLLFFLPPEGKARGDREFWKNVLQRHFPARAPNLATAFLHLCHPQCLKGLLGQEISGLCHLARSHLWQHLCPSMGPAVVKDSPSSHGHKQAACKGREGHSTPAKDSAQEVWFQAGQELTPVYNLERLAQVSMGKQQLTGASPRGRSQQDIFGGSVHPLCQAGLPGTKRLLRPQRCQPPLLPPSPISHRCDEITECIQKHVFNCKVLCNSWHNYSY